MLVILCKIFAFEKSGEHIKWIKKIKFWTKSFQINGHEEYELREIISLVKNGRDLNVLEGNLAFTFDKKSYEKRPELGPESVWVYYQELGNTLGMRNSWHA